MESNENENSDNNMIFNVSKVSLPLNFACLIHPTRIQKLKLYDSTLAIVKGENDVVILVKIIPDQTCPIDEIRIPESLQKTLKIKEGSQLPVVPYDALEYCTALQVEPQFETHGKNYFNEINEYLSTDSHPVSIGSYFIIHKDDKKLTFKVTNCLPDDRCIASRATKIYQINPIPAVRYATSLSIHFSDISLDKSTLDQINKFISLPILHKNLLQAVNSITPNAVLISGKKGSGKTSILSAIAHSLEVPSLYVNVERLLLQPLDAILDTIKKCFTFPSGKSSSLLLFDGIDSLFEKSRVMPYRRIFSLFIGFFDHVLLQKNTIIVGTVHDIDSVDKSITRYGRFGFHIKLNGITQKQCEEIIKLNTKGFNSFNSNAEDISFVAECMLNGQPTYKLNEIKQPQEITPADVKKRCREAIELLMKDRGSKKTDFSIGATLNSELKIEHFGFKRLPPPPPPPPPEPEKIESKVDKKDETKKDTENDDTKEETKDQVEKETKDVVKEDTKDQVEEEIKKQAEKETQDQVKEETKDANKVKDQEEVNEENKENKDEEVSQTAIKEENQNDETKEDNQLIDERENDTKEQENNEDSKEKIDIQKNNDEETKEKQKETKKDKKKSKSKKRKTQSDVSKETENEQQEENQTHEEELEKVNDESTKEIAPIKDEEHNQTNENNDTDEKEMQQQNSDEKPNEEIKAKNEEETQIEVNNEEETQNEENNKEETQTEDNNEEEAQNEENNEEETQNEENNEEKGHNDEEMIKEIEVQKSIKENLIDTSDINIKEVKPEFDDSLFVTPAKEEKPKKQPIKKSSNKNSETTKPQEKPNKPMDLLAIAASLREEFKDDDDYYSDYDEPSNKQTKEIEIKQNPTKQPKNNSPFAKKSNSDKSKSTHKSIESPFGKISNSYFVSNESPFGPIKNHRNSDSYSSDSEEVNRTAFFIQQNVQPETKKATKPKNPKKKAKKEETNNDLIDTTINEPSKSQYETDEYINDFISLASKKNPEFPTTKTPQSSLPKRKQAAPSNDKHLETTGRTDPFAMVEKPKTLNDPQRKKQQLAFVKTPGSDEEDKQKNTDPFASVPANIQMHTTTKKKKSQQTPHNTNPNNANNAFGNDLIDFVLSMDSTNQNNSQNSSNASSQISFNSNTSQDNSTFNTEPINTIQDKQKMPESKTTKPKSTIAPIFVPSSPIKGVVVRRSKFEDLDADENENELKSLPANDFNQQEARFQLPKSSFNNAYSNQEDQEDYYQTHHHHRDYKRSVNDPFAKHKKKLGTENPSNQNLQAQKSVEELFGSNNEVVKDDPFPNINLTQFGSSEPNYQQISGDQGRVKSKHGGFSSIEYSDDDLSDDMNNNQKLSQRNRGNPFGNHSPDNKDDLLDF